MIKNIIMFSSISVGLLYIFTLNEKPIVSSIENYKDEQKYIANPTKVIVNKKEILKKHYRADVLSKKPDLTEDEKNEVLLSSFIREPEQRGEFFTGDITDEEFENQMPTDEELKHMTLDELFNSVHISVYSSVIDEGKWPGQIKLEIGTEEYNKRLLEKYEINYSLGTPNNNYEIRDDGYIPLTKGKVDENEIFFEASQGIVYNDFSLSIYEKSSYTKDNILSSVNAALSGYEYTYEIDYNSKGFVNTFEITINSLPKISEEVEYVKNRLSNLSLPYIGLKTVEMSQAILPEYDTDKYHYFFDL